MPSSVLNINTKFRNNYENTKSTDFIYNLPFPLKNVTSMKYVTADFTNIPYSINSNYGSNNFKLINNSDASVHNIVVQEGNYLGAELAEEITKKIADLNLPNHVSTGNDTATIDVSFNNYKRKFNFIAAVKGAAQIEDISFGLDFTYDKSLLPMEASNYSTNYKTINEQHLSLGWIMGFRNAHYNFAEHYKTTHDTSYGKYEKGLSSESQFERNGSRYYLLMINDYNNNHKNLLISSYQQDTLVDNNVIAKLKYFIDTGDYTIETECCLDVKREYSGNVNINRLQIKLIDEYGRIVDLNNMDYSFALEIETAE